MTTRLDPTTGWLRTLIARVAPTHAIELHCTADGCAAFRLGPLPAEWFADAGSGELLCPQHKAVRRAALEPDEVVGAPLDTLGPAIAPPLDGIDQGEPELAQEPALTEDNGSVGFYSETTLVGSGGGE